ncbi:hypothetical protein [Sphingomonas sp. S-NIH.Pt15_0812]|uniref:hypothetical protein n=1 Tax=Sphingomonas sp. S-NIH.Pt15_0812 TaxID=1920129 RepID=UPI000F7E330A|nr:hypothetical protein [Sphingomonas sp. S-NIH.Pt15_0812]RSU45578.1 hypothetical protein BRX43_18390 [Sphingomonas sp. S-NIH.Pt15_0812]
MTTPYGTTLTDLQVMGDRFSATFDTIEAEFEAEPVVIGMAMIAAIVDRSGREGLEQVLFGARQVRQSLMDEEKAAARVAKQQRRGK